MGSVFQLSKDLSCCLGNRDFLLGKWWQRFFFLSPIWDFVEHCRVTIPLFAQGSLLFNSDVIIHGAPFTLWSAPVIDMVSHLEQWFLTPASTLEEPWILKKPLFGHIGLSCGMWILCCVMWDIFLWYTNSMVMEPRLRCCEAWWA